MLRNLNRFFTLIVDLFDIKTRPVHYARRLGVQVGGRCKLGAIDRGTFGSEPYLVSLGNHVEITYGVRFITHDGGVWVFRDEHPDIDVIAPIRVGNNVFIGMNSIVLPGVVIGDNVVIAAGSIVSRNVPSDSVAAGVPARRIAGIAEYRARSLQRSIGTRGLQPGEKRRHLAARFGAPRDGHH